MLQLLLLLLPVAALSGWYAGFRHKKTSINDVENSQLFQEYFVGLNYLINEQPDKAVDIFIKMLEVNTNTVETHLALGSLFRRKGEVDRAIRIHQNLIARPQLAKKQRAQALFELAQDYLRAGVLDRAERLFLDLIGLGENVSASLNCLINIYQQQKDWAQAITTAKKLEKLGNLNSTSSIAHYYCELAEQAKQAKQNDNAHEYLNEALKYDKNCARANIMTGSLFMSCADYNRAITAFHQVSTQDPEYISEVIAPLAHCYARINDEESFVDYLSRNVEENPRIYFILALADHIQKKSGDAAAISYLAKQSCREPSLRGLLRMMSLSVNNVSDGAREQLLLFKESIETLLQNKPIYRCVHCGFSGKQLYWQCPSCKRWNSVKPIHGLEGD